MCPIMIHFNALDFSDKLLFTPSVYGAYSVQRFTTASILVSAVSIAFIVLIFEEFHRKTHKTWEHCSVVVRALDS